MQFGAKAHRSKIHPSSLFITAAKKKFYPSNPILVSEISSEIILQSLINHKVSRLLQVQKDTQYQTKPQELVMI